MIKGILFAILVLGLAVAGIAVKMFVKKDGEFRKSCSSINPETGERYGCTCGKSESEACENKPNRDEVEFEEIRP
jgi:hypothetical protein